MSTIFIGTTGKVLLSGSGPSWDIVLSCLWDGAYKRSLAAYWTIAHEVVAVGYLTP